MGGFHIPYSGCIALGRVALSPKPKAATTTRSLTTNRLAHGQGTCSATDTRHVAGHVRDQTQARHRPTLTHEFEMAVNEMLIQVPASAHPEFKSNQLSLACSSATCTAHTLNASTRPTALVDSETPAKGAEIADRQASDHQQLISCRLM